MPGSAFIARRLRFEGKMAVTATAISFLVIIIAVAVSGGFRKEIRNGVSRISGDILLTGNSFNYYSENESIDAAPSYLDRILELDGVESVSPAVYRAGIVKTDEDMAGVLVKGVPDSGSASLEASIPSELARILRLGKGDRMTVYFISEKVKVRRFTISDIYEGGIDSGDNLLVYVPIEDMQRLNGWDSTRVSSLEVMLDGRFKDKASLKHMSIEIGSISSIYAEDDEDRLVASSSADRYGQLFDWLDLIDFNVLTIILLMTVVAGFNMISGLLILLFRNISTIGTLKALGMDNKGIAGVFLRMAARIVAIGMAAGNAIALILCFIQSATHAIRLNPENYFVSYVPVEIDIPSILAADAAAFITIMLLLLIPSLFIAKVDPAKTIKAE